MTMQKSFKRLVRSRMEKTGESYTAARAVLLAAEESAVVEGPPLATSNEAIRQRTGRGWEEWFDLLDEWGAAERPHKEVARRVAAELGIEPLAWNAQAITMSYERARGLRVVGERSDGFAVTAQRTVAVPVERLFDSFVDRSLRGRWLADDELRERTATKPKSARFRLGRRRDPGQEAARCCRDRERLAVSATPPPGAPRPPPSGSQSRGVAGGACSRP